MAWLAVLTLAAVSGGDRANAQFTLNMEFNAAGVLPSATPGVSFYNNTGFAESALYAVSGGSLHQQTFALNGNASYTYPNLNETGGPFSPTQTIVLESRIQVSQITGTGAYFQAFDGSFNMAVFLTGSGVTLPTATGNVSVPVDVFAAHTYRLEAAADTRSLSFFIDDALSYSGLAAPYVGLNGFDFGDGISSPGNGANADYDFIRVSGVTPVPEPAGLLVVATSLGLLGGVARKALRIGTP